MYSKAFQCLYTEHKVLKSVSTRFRFGSIRNAYYAGELFHSTLASAIIPLLGYVYEILHIWDREVFESSDYESPMHADSRARLPRVLLIFGSQHPHVERGVDGLASDGNGLA